jgi:hypothetical protein
MYYGGLLIIILLLNSILTIESLDLDHILLCSTIVAKIKGIFRPLENISSASESISTTPFSSVNEEIDTTSDKEYKPSDGINTNDKELPNLPFRDSVVTMINYPGVSVETAPADDYADLDRISNQAVNGSTSTIYITDEPQTVRASTPTATTVHGEVIKTSHNLNEDLNYNSLPVQEQLDLVSTERIRINREAAYKILTGNQNNTDNPFIETANPFSDELAIPFMLISKNLSNKINMETLKDIMIYMLSFLFFVLVILISINITDLTDSSENVLISLSIFSKIKEKFLSFSNKKVRIEVKSNDRIVNNLPNSVETLTNSSSESVNDDWHTCRTHFSSESDIDSGYESDGWYTCAESFNSELQLSDTQAIIEETPRTRLHISWNNGGQLTETLNNDPGFIDPDTGFITEDHPALVNFNRLLTYRQMFYSNNPIVVDPADELFIPFFLIFSNTLLIHKIKNSKLFLNIINSKTFEYLKTSLLFKIFITSILSLLIKYLILTLWSISIDPITNIFIPLLAFHDPMLLENWTQRYFKFILDHTTSFYYPSETSEENNENSFKKRMKNLRKLIKKFLKSFTLNKIDSISSDPSIQPNINIGYNESDNESYFTANESSLEDWHSAQDLNYTDLLNWARDENQDLADTVSDNFTLDTFHTANSDITANNSLENIPNIDSNKKWKTSLKGIFYAEKSI